MCTLFSHSLSVDEFIEKSRHLATTCLILNCAICINVLFIFCIIEILDYICPCLRKPETTSHQEETNKTGKLWYHVVYWTGTSSIMVEYNHNYPVMRLNICLHLIVVLTTVYGAGVCWLQFEKSTHVLCFTQCNYFITASYISECFWQK